MTWMKLESIHLDTSYQNGTQLPEYPDGYKEI